MRALALGKERPSQSAVWSLYVPILGAVTRREGGAVIPAPWFSFSLSPHIAPLIPLTCAPKALPLGNCED